MAWMLFLFGLAAGLFCSILIGALTKPSAPVGDLIVVDSEDGPYLFVELNNGVDELSKSKDVRLKVKKRVVSQKTH